MSEAPTGEEALPRFHPEAEQVAESAGVAIDDLERFIEAGVVTPDEGAGSDQAMSHTLRWGPDLEPILGTSRSSNGLVRSDSRDREPARAGRQDRPQLRPGRFPAGRYAA